MDAMFLEYTFAGTGQRVLIAEEEASDNGFNDSLKMNRWADARLQKRFFNSSVDVLLRITGVVRRRKGTC